MGVTAKFVDELPSKSQIFDHWKDQLQGLVRFVDWGEPSCWVCGFHHETKYDIKRSDGGWDAIFQSWDAIPLQRCHIVPRSLGGSNDVSNLFLMCRECHDLAPNTNVPEVFFEWCRHQSQHSRDQSRIEEAFKSFSIGEAEQELLLEVIMSDGFKAWSRNRAGIHWPQSGYASRLSRLTPATLVGLAVHYFVKSNISA